MANIKFSRKIFEKDIIKIRTTSFVEEGKEYFTEFKITPKTKKYLENERISLACLLPEAWEWYEVILFDLIDEDVDGIPDKKFGNKFEVIYYGIIESRNYTVEDIIEKGFEEDIKKLKEKSILESEMEVKSVKNKDKEFSVKYILIKK